MLHLSRVDGWPDRMLSVIERHRAHDFAWGSYDCATLFADCVEAVTGSDPLCDFRPWDSDRDALRALAASGVRTMAEFCHARFPERPVAFARRGDLVLPGAATPLMCPAIVTGSEAVSRDQSGWIVAPLAAMSQAWAVG